MEVSTDDPLAAVKLAPSGFYFQNRPEIHFNPVTLFLREVHGRLLRHITRVKVSTNRSSVEVLARYAYLLETSEVRGDEKSWLLRHSDGQITLIELAGGWANIATAGRDPTKVKKTCAAVTKALRSEDQGHIVPITFWALNPDQWPHALMRKLESPSWQEVAGNYDGGVAAGMERLLSLRQCPNERMILWHGAPGTGKTHALRALIREWRAWCDAAFITDPERFVGGSPMYLFQVATFNAGHTPGEARKRSKLIILEDAGELMTTNARAVIGQGLSRLLNLTDGILGQGLGVMVLITTNEPLSAMHPAVVRAGRCLGEIEFGALPTIEANQWLHDHGSDKTVNEPTLLAQLYVIANGRPARAIAPIER